MSIRLRLTLVYSVILALVLIALNAALYLTVSRVTLSGVETTLADEAKRLINAKQVQYNRILIPASKFAAPETYVQTLDPEGRVTDKTGNLGEHTLPLDRGQLRAIQAGQSVLDTVHVEGRRLLVYSEPIVVEGYLVGVIQVARSLADQDQSLATLKTILITGSTLVLFVAFGIGWLLSGMALRPINRITHTAQEIGAERDFDRRVSYSGPNDELGQLAVTLNTMLTELQAAYRQSEQTLQAQRRFVADASHELRTPLTTIRGNLALLQREPPIAPEDRVAVLSDMVDECERLIRLVNDLLTLARTDAGRAFRTDPVRVQPLLDDLCRQARLIGPDRTVVCDDVPDVAVLANRDAIKQVLLILVDNALKFTPARGTVTLSARVRDGLIAISVADTGVGIASDALPHIFNRFYRGDSARTGGGAGLGLAIAKAIVDAHGGSIQVRSELGHGSVFTVLWPQAPVIRAPEPPTVVVAAR